MFKKRLIAILFASLVATFLFASSTFAETADEIFSDEEENCSYTEPETRSFDAKFISVRRQLRVEPSEVFRVKVFMRNNSNITWFSTNSSCEGPKTSLGTDKERDRASAFYTPNIEGIENTNWTQENRVAMDQLRIEPGQIASFTFWSKAGQKTDFHKEYFTPMVEGSEWMENAQFSFEVMTGRSGESPVDLRKKVSYAIKSGSIAGIDLNAPKSIVVDLSDQKMLLRLGDRVIREFWVSSGKSSTPTPYGTTHIISKQNIRVGIASPHYIMPKFMMFRAGGYGIHALPSLGNDRGVFWTEAWNHIGRPVSHGCIRLLPRDANFVYDFAEIGTTVIVQP